MRRKRLGRRAWQSLGWGLAGFAIFTALAGRFAERQLPARDPEFAAKLTSLQAIRRQCPDRPLVLMLGSSRTALGFRAGEVEAQWRNQPIVAFNFGLSGGGPLNEYLCLDRLRAAGIRPDFLLIEVLLPTLNQAGRNSLEEMWLQGDRLRQGEIRRLTPYHSEPERMWRRWLRCRLLPWAELRRGLPHLLPSTMESIFAGSSKGWGPIDPYGWEPHFMNGVTEPERQHYWQIAQAQYRDSTQRFQLASQPLEALAALLHRCRSERIPVGIILMPEGPRFRSLYAPEVKTGFDQWIHEFCRDQGLPLVDARNWVVEEELWDSHHALPSGARSFTRRLNQDALPSLLGGADLPGGKMAISR